MHIPQYGELKKLWVMKGMMHNSVWKIVGLPKGLNNW